MESGVINLAAVSMPDFVKSSSMKVSYSQEEPIHVAVGVKMGLFETENVRESCPYFV